MHQFPTNYKRPPAKISSVWKQTRQVGSQCSNTAERKKNYESFFDNCKNVLKIVNIGRLTDQKNQIIILKALANLKDKLSFRFIIMGSGNLKKNLLSSLIK